MKAQFFTTTGDSLVPSIVVRAENEAEAILLRMVGSEASKNGLTLHGYTVASGHEGAQSISFGVRRADTYAQIVEALERGADRARDAVDQRRTSVAPAEPLSENSTIK